MEGKIIVGGIIGAVIGHIIAAASSTGPKYPGDTNYESKGPGCLLYLLILVVCGLIGMGIAAYI